MHKDSFIAKERPLKKEVSFLKDLDIDFVSLLSTESGPVACHCDDCDAGTPGCDSCDNCDQCYSADD